MFIYQQENYYIIFHSDIKPENILVSSDGAQLVVKLADFGFAKKDVTQNSLTTLCGSPSYIAPEILKKQRYGVKCDLWSAGVLSFVLLGGYQPFHGKTDQEIKTNIVSGTFKFDGKYWGHISESAKDFIKSLLIVNPEDRVSAEDILSHSWLNETIALTAPNEASYEKPVSVIKHAAYTIYC